MNKKTKYLIFFIGLFFVGLVVYLSLFFQIFWGYLFTLLPILAIVKVVDDKPKRRK
jgi:hypothetical protein